MPRYLCPFSRLFNAVALTLSLSGCLADQSLDLGNRSVESGDTTPASILAQIDYPVIGSDGEQISPENLRHSQKSTLLALKALLDGYEGEELEAPLAVRGPEGFSNTLGPLTGFQVERVTLTPQAGVIRSSDVVATAGTMSLADPAGRRLDLIFSLLGERQGGLIELAQAEVTPVMPGNLKSEAFIVPQDRLTPHLAAGNENYERFYNQVKSLALSELDIRHLPRGTDDYFVVVFLKDPLLKQADLEIRLSSSRSGLNGNDTESDFLTFPGGWAVAVVESQMNLSQSREQWVKVIRHAPASETGRDGQIHLTDSHPLTQGAQSAAKIRAEVL